MTFEHREQETAVALDLAIKEAAQAKVVTSDLEGSGFSGKSGLGGGRQGAPVVGGFKEQETLCYLAGSEGIRVSRTGDDAWPGGCVLEGEGGRDRADGTKGKERAFKFRH